MKNILVFSTSSGNARTEMIKGVREFAHGTDWNIQAFEFEGTPFPVRDLVRFWSPVGCIVEASGSGMTKDTVPWHSFGKTPVVYIGGDSHVVPPNATCVVHDAVATGEAAARDLLTMELVHFAFLGLKDREWSLRRENAFAEALRLNGRQIDTFNLPTGGKDIHSLKRWLAALPKPCGILAANDATAETALAVCRILNIPVPDDIVIIGVDDNEEICENTVPTLSSIHPDFRQGGRFAARLLAKKMRNATFLKNETVFSVSGVVRRGSTRRFKRRDAYVSAALERIWRADGISLSPREILCDFPCSRRSAEIRFRQTTGHSVLEELVKARIHHAKQLLNETQLPVSAIAERCGYRSVAHFRVAFARLTDSTPKAWRQSRR